MRVAGANAGQVVSLDLDRRTQKALVEVEITEKGFGSLRSDVFCESRPQSPIGEYFVDCLPGRAKRELRTGQPDPGEADGVHDPAGPDPEHHAASLPGAFPADHQRVRRRAGRPPAGPQRRDPQRGAGSAPERPPAGGARAPRHRDPRPGDQRGHGAQAALGQPPQRGQVRGRGARHLRRVGRARRRHPDELPQAARLPRAAHPHDGRAGRDRARAAAGAGGPERERGRAAPLLRRHRRLRHGVTAGRAGPRRGRGARPGGIERGEAQRARAAALRAPHARPRAQPADRAGGLRRPLPRGGARPAQPGRAGLLRHRGAAPVRLQPVAHQQRLRRGGLHGAHRGLHRQVRALSRRRVRKGPRAGRLPVMARAQPARGDHARSLRGAPAALERRGRAVPPGAGRRAASGGGDGGDPPRALDRLPAPRRPEAADPRAD